MIVTLLNTLDVIARNAQANNLTVVHCHGCFDLLHVGHVRYLQEAKELGDILVVSVTADSFVNKGPDRPIFSAQKRAEMLDALRSVDYVWINHAGNANQVLRALRPNVYVKGMDYADTDCEEFQVAREVGATVAFTTTEKFSSTEIINRLKNGNIK